MSTEFQIAVLLVACWASLPFIMVYSTIKFDESVIREGEEH